MPGWDCHGLPIEHKVETTFGKNQPSDLTRERCRTYAAEQIEGQKADFVRLGVLGDWDNPYKTMDFAGDLYGRRLTVAFHHKLRDEQRFASLEALKTAIAADIAAARAHWRV